MKELKNNYIKLNDDLIEDIIKYYRLSLDTIEPIESIEDKELEFIDYIYKNKRKFLNKSTGKIIDNYKLNEPLALEWFNKITKRELRRIKRDLLDAGLSEVIIDDEGIKNKIIVVKNHYDITLEMMNNRMDYNVNKTLNKLDNIILEDIRKDKEVNKIKEKVVKKVVKDKIGVKVDRKGREWSVEPYLDIVEKGNEKRIIKEVKDRMFDDNDIELVIVSELSDSRPSHIDFQGNIYSIRGNHPKYPPLSVTGYGEIDGIETGINCRHRTYPFIEGISKTVKKEYDKRETIENYKNSQKQRYNERNIRNAKREYELMKEIGVDDETLKKSKSRVTYYQTKQREFIKETGLTRDYNREQLGYTR